MLTGQIQTTPGVTLYRSMGHDLGGGGPYLVKQSLRGRPRGQGGGVPGGPLHGVHGLGREAGTVDQFP